MSPATFVLVPGAASSPWHWHLLQAQLLARGHEVVCVDLPVDDDSAGLPEYADAVVRAAGGRSGLVLVAHSFAGFTAPLVCDRLPVELLVMVNAMLPSPGEPPRDWWAATGHEEAAAADAEREGRAPDADAFFHDLPPDLAAEATARLRDQSDTPFAEPWPLRAWPDVPTGHADQPAGPMRTVRGRRSGRAYRGR